MIYTHKLKIIYCFCDAFFCAVCLMYAIYGHFGINHITTMYYLPSQYILFYLLCAILLFIDFCRNYWKLTQLLDSYLEEIETIEQIRDINAETKSEASPTA